MTTALAPVRPQPGAGRTTFVALAARELRRFTINPIFLFAVAMTAWTTWTPSAAGTEIDSVNGYTPTPSPRDGRPEKSWTTLG